jgi:hypothetical protein
MVQQAYLCFDGTVVLAGGFAEIPRYATIREIVPHCFHANSCELSKPASPCIVTRKAIGIFPIRSHDHKDALGKLYEAGMLRLIQPVIICNNFAGISRPAAGTITSIYYRRLFEYNTW